MNKNNLRHNLLTYIAYCLDDKFFSYEKCQKDFDFIGIVSTIPTLRKEFSLCKKEKLIDFKTFYKKPYPVLTIKGKLEIKTRLPFKKYSDFNNTWKIVIFELPETRKKDRLKIHRALLELGFGKISRAVYISPHGLFSPIKRLASKLGVEEYLVYLRTKDLEEEKKQIFRAWDLDDLNYKYEQFMTKVRYASFEKKPFWPIYAKSLEKEFAALYAEDPHLPEEFLPAKFKGKEAYGIFKALANSY